MEREIRTTASESGNEIVTSLRILVTPEFSWVGDVDSAELATLWQWYRGSPNAVFDGVTELETGGTETLGISLSKDDAEKSIVITVVDEQGSWIDPGAYFNDPDNFSPHINQQLRDYISPYVEMFLSMGHVRNSQTYELVCAMDPLEYGPTVTQENDTDVISFDMHGVRARVKLKTIGDELDASLAVCLPKHVRRTLKKIPDVSFKFKRFSQEFAMPIEFDGRSVRLTSANPYASHKHITRWFDQSTKELTQQLDYFAIFLDAPTVYFPQTWRMLAGNKDVTYDEKKSSPVQDRLHTTIWKDHGTRSFRLDIGLTVIPVDHDADGIWEMEASCAVSRPVALPDIGYPDNDVLVSAWNAWTTREKKSKAIASRHDEDGVHHVLRVVPRIDGESLKLVVVWEINGVVYDAFAAHDFFRDVPVGTLDEIRAHMDVAIDSFEQFVATDMEALIRQEKAMKPVEIPWVARALRENAYRATGITVERVEGVNVDLPLRGIEETVSGILRVDGQKKEHKFGLLYDPEDKGIALAIALEKLLDPNTVDLLNAKTQDIVLFPQTQYTIKGLSMRCTPVFTANRLTMHLGATELFALHALRPYYWDDLILREMLVNARQAMDVLCISGL